MDWNQFDIDLLCLKKNSGPANNQFTHPACSKAPANDETFGVLPFLYFEETADHQGEFLGKVFNRSVNNSSRLGVAARKDFVEFLLGQFLAGVLAQGIRSDLPEFRAPVFDKLAEGAFAGAITDKSL